MRVALFGTSYGATYLEPILENRWLTLVALGSRGSARSRQLGRLLDVPVHVSDRDLVRTEKPDLAIVAVPDADAIVLRLLARGVHVLAEHPVTSSLAQKAAQMAAKNDRIFAVNAHFVDLPAPRRFLQLCARAGRRQAALVDVHGRALYSALDMLDRSLGSLDLANVRAVVGVASDPARWPPASIVATSRGVPVSIQIAGGHKHRDDVSDHVVGHRLSIGFARETITLVDTFGPVVRIPKHAAPAWRVVDEPMTLARGVLERKAANALALKRVLQAVGGKLDRSALRADARRVYAVAKAFESIRRLTRADAS